MSFLTCFWLFPQNEHFSRSPPSPMRATRQVLPSTVPTMLTCQHHKQPTLPREQHCAPPLNAGNTARRSRVRQERTPRRVGVRSRRAPDRSVRRFAAFEDLVDQAVLLGLRRGQDLVPLDVLLDLLGRAP